MSNYKEEQNAKVSIKADNIIKDLPDFCRQYFVGRSRRISDNTKISYATQLKMFFNYLIENNSYFKKRGLKGITIEDIGNLSAFDIEEFLDYLKKPSNPTGQLSDSSVEHYIATLSSFYKYMCTHGILSNNPMSAIEHVKRTEKDVIYLDDSERERFIDSVTTVTPCKSGHISSKKTRDALRNTAIIKLFLSTGLRVSELAGLDLKDINWNDHSLSAYRKGGDLDADIFFSDEAQLALEDYLSVREEYNPQKGETALFLSGRGGKRMTIRGIEAMVGKYADKTDLNGKHITPHKLRSSFAIHRLDNNGRDVMDVKDALHHKNIQTTMIYLKKTDREIKKSNRNL